MNLGDRKGLQQFDQRVGLLLTLLVQRTLPIVTRPVAPASRLRVPDDIEAAAQGIHARRRLRSSASHTFRQRARASSAASLSSAMSSPATNARLPLTFAERSQACAVTLSWCSPRMVCSLAAARAKAAAPPATGATASAAYRARLARIRMRWSSGSVGVSGSPRTAERSRRRGVVTSAGGAEGAWRWALGWGFAESDEQA